MPNPQVTMITLTVAPCATSAAHEHTGQVFACLLEGEIENQVDPNPPRRYKAGEFFYEPPMHVHRSLWNLNNTEAPKLLIFEVGEKGKPFTIGAK
jgi:quercetin dioxygenase-like cupin family protein